MDRKDLKIQALLEKVASLTQSYENQVADLRVELTWNAQESQQQIAELQAKVAEHEAPDPSEAEPELDSPDED